MMRLLRWLKLSGIKSGDLTKSPFINLLITNLVPIIGVLFFNWDAALLLVLFWAENTVTAFFTFFMILRTNSGRHHRRLKFLTYFVQLFSAVLFQGVFLAFIVFPWKSTVTSSTGSLYSLWNMQFLLSLVVVVSQIVTLVMGDFRQPKLTRRQIALKEIQFFRFFIVQMIIFGVGFMTLIIGSPIYAMLLLIVLKVYFDTRKYDDERIPKVEKYYKHKKSYGKSVLTEPPPFRRVR